MRLTSRLIILARSAGLAVPLGLVAAVAPAAAAATAPAGPGTAVLAPAAGTGTSQWPQFGQSPRHLNTNPAEKAFNTGNVSSMRTLFTADFGGNTASEGGPAVANGVLYQGGFDGNLNAYPATGCGQPSCQPMWQGKAADDFTSTPAVAGGLVFIASADHFLYAFPAAGCGAAVWRGRPGRPTCWTRWSTRRSPSPAAWRTSGTSTVTCTRSRPPAAVRRYARRCGWATDSRPN